MLVPTSNSLYRLSESHFRFPGPAKTRIPATFLSNPVCSTICTSSFCTPSSLIIHMYLLPSHRPFCSFLKGPRPACIRIIVKHTPMRSHSIPFVSHSFSTHTPTHTVCTCWWAVYCVMQVRAMQCPFSSTHAFAIQCEQILAFDLRYLR